MTDIVLGTGDGHAADTDTLYMLYSLVRYMRPALIVEAGTYKGAATCVMAGALRDTKTDGVVWSADVQDYGAAEQVAKNDLGEYIRLYHGDFRAMLDGPLAGQGFRLAFIDSGFIVGSGDGVSVSVRAQHSNAAFDRLRPGGVLAVDDAAGEWVGIEELREKASIYLPNSRGLILVQRL